MGVVRPTVLIVDDHEAFRASAKALLQAGGFDVIGEASGGMEAIEAVSTLRPEVVVLDIQLSDLDGLAVAERIAEAPDPPVVHHHRWNAPPSQGNNQILVVLNASEVVHLGGPAHLTNHGVAQPVDPRLLMLKSPMMNGADVEAVQQALNQRNHAGLATDGVYNPATRDAVVNWQRHEQIEVDGIVGPHTRSTLGLPASTHVPA
jgi:CheY-like chemotaxis protein